MFDALPPPALVDPAALPAGYARQASGLILPERMPAIEAGVVPGIGGALGGRRLASVVTLGAFTAAGSGSISQAIVMPSGIDLLIALSGYMDDNNSDSRTITSCTFNAVALTTATSQSDGATGRAARAFIFYMLNPPSGGTFTFLQTVSASGDKGQRALLLGVRGVNHLADTGVWIVGGSTTQQVLNIDLTRPGLVVGSATGQYNGVTTFTSAQFDNKSFVNTFGSGYTHAAFWKVEPGPVTAKTYQMLSNAGLVNASNSGACAAAFDFV